MPVLHLVSTKLVTFAEDENLEGTAEHEMNKTKSTTSETTKPGISCSEQGFHQFEIFLDW